MPARKYTCRLSERLEQAIQAAYPNEQTQGLAQTCFRRIAHQLDVKEFDVEHLLHPDIILDACNRAGMLPRSLGGYLSYVTSCLKKCGYKYEIEYPFLTKYKIAKAVANKAKNDVYTTKEPSQYQQYTNVTNICTELYKTREEDYDNAIMYLIVAIYEYMPPIRLKELLRIIMKKDTLPVDEIVEIMEDSKKNILTIPNGKLYNAIAKTHNDVNNPDVIHIPREIIDARLNLGKFITSRIFLPNSNGKCMTELEYNNIVSKLFGKGTTSQTMRISFATCRSQFENDDVQAEHARIMGHTLQTHREFYICKNENNQLQNKYIPIEQYNEYIEQHTSYHQTIEEQLISHKQTIDEYKQVISSQANQINILVTQINKLTEYVKMREPQIKAMWEERPQTKK